MFETLLQVMANATLPIVNIPATLTPMLGNTNSLDISSVPGIIALMTAGFAAWKDHANDKKQSTRANALADNDIGLADSLKATDIGVKDNATNTNMLAQTLAQHPDLQKLLTDSQNGVDSKCILELIKNQSSGWDTAIKEYYQNQPRVNNEFSKDPVLAKSAEVAKVTSPTPSA